MSSKFLSVLFCLLLAVAAPASADFVQSELDLGAADSIGIEFPVIPHAATNQMQLQMDVHVFNDANTLSAIGIGFFWDNPNFVLDSVTLTPKALSAFNFGQYFYYKNDIDSSNFYDLCQLGLARSGGPGYSTEPNRQLVASYYFTAASWTVNDSITIDTTHYSGSTILAFADVQTHLYTPYWIGGRVIHDSDYTGPTNLVISEDTLFFESVQGEATPVPQTFTVESDNGPLTFSLQEDASWLQKSPNGGATPRTISVSISTLGLSPATYFDSIRVSATGADNSPQYVYVQFDYQEPPPTIGVNVSQMVFNAIAGGGNPTAQILSITNTGGSSLMWTVDNDEAWLMVSPSSGTDDGDATVSVDIAGLDYGDYFDTLIVSDPEATNDPVLIPVRLSILSSLPVIDVDTIFNFVVDEAELPEFTRLIEVRNGGGGDLNFWVQRKVSASATVPELIGFDPDTALAPQIITLEYSGSTPYVDFIKTDTVLVFCNEAANSPVEVEVNLKIVVEPALIGPSANPVVVDVYECQQGMGMSLEPMTFQISNFGGDDPMEFDLAYESDMYSLDVTSGTAPQTITLTPLVEDMPVGTYLDTIVVTSTWAMNNPLELIVHYNINEGDEGPEIEASRAEFLWPYQIGTGALADSGFTVCNRFGGCMPWQIENETGWMTTSITEGNANDHLNIIVEPVGLTIGEYVDTVSVLAVGATNSPLELEMKLQVWLYRGDWDWDGIVSMTDLTLMINWLFIDLGDIPPMPVMEVGNTDCEGTEITMSDLTALIDHLFISLDPICGNP